ncbi:hypothetical protein ACEQPO_08990 [Bacillus sp. SL00103]
MDESENFITSVVAMLMVLAACKESTRENHQHQMRSILALCSQMMVLVDQSFNDFFI